MICPQSLHSAQIRGAAYEEEPRILPVLLLSERSSSVRSLYNLLAKSRTQVLNKLWYRRIRPY